MRMSAAAAQYFLSLSVELTKNTARAQRLNPPQINFAAVSIMPNLYSICNVIGMIIINKYFCVCAFSSYQMTDLSFSHSQQSL